MSKRLRLAEWVLPGHPDKLCDAIADRLVDRALEHDSDALVGVEVAVHRGKAFVDGRMAAGEVPLGMEDVEEAVRAAYREAGYSSEWCPDPGTLTIDTDLCLENLSDDERDARGVSDDQNVVVGYASGDGRTNYLPIEQWLAHRLARTVWQESRTRRDVLGPDGKLLVALEADGGSVVARAVSLSLHHAECVDWIALLRDVRRMVLTEMEGAASVLPELRFDEGLRIELNGAGNFAVGGPYGDNGLSGKKLVVDHYGPGVPIGGGAMSGKDPHKVDRAGALRARQVAKAVVETGLANEARVLLGFLPGDREPTFLEIEADGRPLSPAAVARWRGRYDLSLDGTFRELGLADVRFAPLALWGHFTDPDLPWEVAPDRGAASL